MKFSLRAAHDDSVFDPVVAVPGTRFEIVVNGQHFFCHPLPQTFQSRGVFRELCKVQYLLRGVPVVEQQFFVIDQKSSIRELLITDGSPFEAVLPLVRHSTHSLQKGEIRFAATVDPRDI